MPEASSRRLSLEEFEACAADFDHCVDHQPGVDRFCSRSEWVLPFHRAFLPDRELFVYRGVSDPHGSESADTFAAFAAREHPSVGRYLEALETMWCFACPLLGRGSAELLDAAIADASPTSGLVPVVLSGVPMSRDRSGVLAEVVTSLDGRYDLRAVDSTLRFVASLAGGLDGWLSRRSRSFRRNLRAAGKKASAEGVGFEWLRPTTGAELQTAYERVLDIETRSWKSAEGTGVEQGTMRAFYDDMLPRLAARGGLRAVVATIGGRDVGYVHGAVTDDHFRGLQISSDRDRAQLSLGNLLQREMIEGLCEEGVRSYDLGTRSEYKRRWAEEGLRTLTILARPL